MYDNTGPARPARPRLPASEARLRAMARQITLARGQVEEHAEHELLSCPRPLVLRGLARRSLPVCDQARLLGLAREGGESTC